MIAVPAIYFVNTGQYICIQIGGVMDNRNNSINCIFTYFEIESIWWLKPFTLYSAFVLALVSWMIYYRDYFNVFRGKNV